MEKSIFFIKEGPKEVDFDMEKVFLSNEAVDVVSTASENLKILLDEKLLKLDNILKERHGELINCLKDVELRVERVEKEMLDNGFRSVQRGFIASSDFKDFEKKSSDIDDSFSKKDDNLPNISIGQEELDALLEGINYTPKENEGVQYDAKFNKGKDLNLTSNLNTIDSFSNDLIKKENVDVSGDDLLIEDIKLNNSKSNDEKSDSFSTESGKYLDSIDKNSDNNSSLKICKSCEEGSHSITNCNNSGELDHFVDNNQSLDLINENESIEHENIDNRVILEDSGERLELKEFDDFESILKEDLDSQVIEDSFSSTKEKNLYDKLKGKVDKEKSDDIADFEKPIFQNITDDHYSSSFDFNDVEKVVSKFNVKESLSNVMLNSDEKAVLINFIDRVESELELNPNRNIFKIKQEYEVLKKIKFLLTKT
ncbi:hypothetical protein OY14_03755 [Borreliella chilensis]|uniref:Uncharacterized protein n=1 Tax=Borreliella chilensis TaxID=1245910 RepID=A0A0A7UYN6_9SPIR|nr:hypothetical protein OY14_03755 [Borreliella chilensis]